MNKKGGGRGSNGRNRGVRKRESGKKEEKKERGGATVSQVASSF